MKTKNPSRITLARRAVDEAIFETARVIGEMLSAKDKAVYIAARGSHFAELYHVQAILVSHEQARRRELTREAVQKIGSIIKGYTEVKKDDNTSWLGILKPMVEQHQV